MKKMYKVMLLVLCAALLVAGSVMGTLAYLKDTKSVTNTFTVGKVEITLDEAKTDAYGVAVEGAARVTGNQYKLIPGHEYTKDPVVTVVAKSEKCYLYVKVNNGIAGIEANENGNDTIEEQILANGWVKLTGVNNVYYKVVDASASETNIPCPVFGKFTIASNANVADYGSAKIEITAYAIQADGFDDAQEAWTAGNFGA